MQRQMTFRQYRALDLTMLTGLLCLCEALIALAATRWFPGEPWTLSLTPAMTAIVMVRWGWWGAIPAGLGAVAFCVASGATAAQYMIYVVGNMLVLPLVLLLKKGWPALKEKVLLAMVYGLGAAIMMQLGRFLVALLQGTAPAMAAGFFTTDTLSTLFAVLLLWIARRLDGVLEEQRHYLSRVREEMAREKEQAGGIGSWQ